MADATLNPRSVFRRGGQKAEISFADESVDYEAIAEEKLSQLLTLWSQPRTGTHLSAAVWRADSMYVYEEKKGCVDW